MVAEPIKLFRTNSQPAKSKLSVVDEIVINTPRKPMQLSVDMSKKTTSGQLRKMRDAIGTLFNDAKVFSAWTDAVKLNKLMNDDIVTEKFGSYNDEFKRLHKAVQDAFRMAGRADLADQFGSTVGLYTDNYHPIDFIASLLKGAGNPIVVAAQNNQYSMLEPFKGAMQEALASRGMASPNDLATLSQLFYNTVIAKADSENDVYKFDEMSTGDTYHADEAVSNAIVVYFKTLADKKTAGVQLSKVEDKLATVAQKVESSLVNTAKSEVDKEIGGVITSNSKTIMIIAGIALVVLVYMAFRK